MWEEDKLQTFKNKFRFITNNEEKSEKMTQISLSDIFPNPYQPRRTFDLAALNELSESIREVGVITPITVRRVPGGYEIVCGERRVRAASMAGLDKIPAIIVDISDRDSAVMAITENLQRKDLTFFEEAESMQSLIQCHNLTQDNVAKKLGKSQAAVANKIRLLKLSESVRAVINEGNLCERHARAFLRLPLESMQLAAAKRAVDLKLNVSATEKMVQKMIEEENKLSFMRKESHSYDKTGRLFKNTLNKTFEMLKKSGLTPTISEKEDENYIEITIKLEK